MGQKRTIQIPLTKGLDERISRKILPDGTLSVLHNSRIDKLGKVVRRNGWGEFFPPDTEYDPYAAAKTMCALGITETDESLELLTTRRMYRLSPGDQSWLGMGPDDGRPAATTPIETLDVPLSTWASSNTAADSTRKGTGECHSAAIVADPSGGAPGSFVLLASRSAESGSSVPHGWGHVQLTGYRTWIDDFGQRHWEQVFTKSYTTYPSVQLRAWRVGTSLYAGWVSEIDPESDTYGLYVARWTPRTTAGTAPTATLITTVDSIGFEWDVAAPATDYAVAGENLFLIAITHASPSTLQAFTLQEDLGTYASTSLGPGDLVANKVACCWAQTGGQQKLCVFWAKTSSAYLRGGWLLGPGLTSPTTITWATGSEAPEQLTAHHSLVDDTIVAWTTCAKSSSAPTLRYWQADAHKFTNAGVFSSTTTSVAPGKLASKVFSWDGRDIAWWLTGAPNPVTINVTLAEAAVNRSLSEPPTSIDGVTLANGTKVLLTAQTNPVENGCYNYNTGGASPVLERYTSFPIGGDAQPIQVYVTSGSTNARTYWAETGSPSVINTNSLTYEQGTNGMADYTDRHYVLALTESDVGNCTPLAIVSPHQAADFSAAHGGSNLTTVGSIHSCDHTIWHPTDYVWAAPEAIGGNTERWPQSAPRIHAWHDTPVMRVPLEIKDRMVFAAQGLPQVYGDSGAQELAFLNGPGPIAALAVAGVGFPAGAYSYRVVYRMIRHDGSMIRSLPSTTATVVVPASMGSVRVNIRTPRLTALTDDPGSLLSIHVDVYRTEVGPEANFYLLGTAVIGTDNTSATLTFTDNYSVRDEDLRARELLYTLTTNDIPAVTVPSFRAICLHGGRIFGAHGRRLYYSTQQASLTAPYFPAGGYLEFEEPITGLGSLEMGLVVFSRSRTWLLSGTGPGPNLEPFWPQPQLLAKDVGCVSQVSVMSWRDGLFFQSDIGIEILRKNGAIETFSDPVRDELREGFPVVRKVLESIEDGQIRWLCSVPGCYPDESTTFSRWLCWDYGHQQWSTESAIGCLDCTTQASFYANAQSLFSVTREAAGGVSVYGRSPTSGWYDGHTTPTTYPTRTLTSGWIRPQGIGGWGRLRRLRLHGDTPAYAASVEGETVTVTIKQHSEDDCEVFSEHTVVVAAPGSTDTAEQVLIELAPANQQCSEFRIQISQTVPCDLDHPVINVKASLLTTANLSGLPTADGVTLIDGDRLLLIQQSNQVQRGVWVVHSGAWTRPIDWAAGSLASVNVVYIEQGSARAGTYWYDDDDDVIGTDSITFSGQYYRGGEGTGWNALSFDWEDLANRPRTTILLRA